MRCLPYDGNSGTVKRGEVESPPLRKIERLLHLHDTPRRTAVAFALGVFFSFSPFLGLQIALAMSLALLLGLNRLAVFVGLNANLPWIVIPWYAGTTMAAAKLMGMALAVDLRREMSLLFSLSLFSRDFWHYAASVLNPIVIPFVVGPTIGAAIMGLTAYPTAYAILKRSAAARR